MRLTEEQLQQHQRRIVVIRPVPVVKAPKVPESVVARQCILILSTHPAVKFWWRQNTGGVSRGNGRYIKFGFRGAADFMGILAGGRFLAVETKMTGEKLTKDQSTFLATVNEAGGLGLMVDDPDQLVIALKGLKR